MKTVALDIVLEGKDAEKLRDKIEAAVRRVTFNHPMMANVEITRWNMEAAK